MSGVVGNCIGFHTGCIDCIGNRIENCIGFHIGCCTGCYIDCCTDCTGSSSDCCTGCTSFLPGNLSVGPGLSIDCIDRHSSVGSFGSRLVAQKSDLNLR